MPISFKEFKKNLEERCWPGYKPAPGKKAYDKGSCVKEEEVVEGSEGTLWRVEKSDSTGRFYVVKGYNKARKVWKNEWGASDHTHQQDAQSRADQLNNGVSEDWQKVNRQDKTDGLSPAAVKAYRRENPGSKLQTAVTEKNPKGKRASRRKSFCSRMGGMKKRLTSAKNARDPDSPINKALRRWNC